MLTLVRPAVVMLALFTALTGLAYPMAITGVAQVLAHGSANGSLVRQGDRTVGSRLIGQAFTSDRYFQGRPSAAGEKGYDAAASSGSNLGPLSRKLLDRVDADVASLRKTGAEVIPADAVTSSASGLDPHISPDFAELQLKRVATARGTPVARVRAVLVEHIERPALGFIGEPRVNVLLLNIALDAAIPESAR